jgi:mono/diheme cytochrome c family protein
MPFPLTIRTGLVSGVILATVTSHHATVRPVPATLRAASSADSLAVTETEYQGWKVYHANCDRCHGQDATGSSFAPNLRHSVGPQGSLNSEAFVDKTTNGVVDKGMPAWKGTLSREQMEDVYAYVRARSTGRLAPGRPHVASAARKDS